MPIFWQGLLANLAIVAAVVSVWTNTRDVLPTSTSVGKALSFGCLMGLGTILVMSMPVALAPGLMIDMRSALLASTGFFGGPLAGLAAGAIGALYRAALGGIGAWAGCVGIGFATVVGVLAHLATRGRTIRKHHLVLLAAVAAAGNGLTVLVLPRSAQGLYLPVLETSTFLNFVATLLAALAFLQDERRRTLSHSNMVYRAIIRTLPDCLNAKDLDGKFIAANPATAELMRAPSPESLIGKTDFDFYPNEVARRFRSDEERVLAVGEPDVIEQCVAFDDGTAEWLATLKVPLRDTRGHTIGLVTHNRNITAKKRLEEAFAAVRQHLAGALEHMADGLVLLDANGVIVLCNERYRALFPITAKLRHPGARIADILRASAARGEQPFPPGADVEASLAERTRGVMVQGDELVELADGRWLETRVRPVEDGGCLVLVTDVSDRKRAADALALANLRLAELASTDALTGLKNRRSFDEDLEREFARSARAGTPLSLILVDVDRFKAYNDTYGHPAGDECLKLIATELKAHLRRPADLAARYGGEELVAILPDTPAAGAQARAELFRSAIRKLQIPHVGSEFGIVTVSVGVATCLSGRIVKRHQELLRLADGALYLAKGSGRDQVRGQAELVLGRGGRPAQGGVLTRRPAP